jgi:hypothetical protein
LALLKAKSYKNAAMEAITKGALRYNPRSRKGRSTVSSMAINATKNTAAMANRLRIYVESQPYFWPWVIASSRATIQMAMVISPKASSPGRGGLGVLGNMNGARLRLNTAVGSER